MLYNNKSFFKNSYDRRSSRGYVFNTISLFAYVFRNIAVNAIGVISKLIFVTEKETFPNLHKVLKHIEPYFAVIKLFYVLTNRSSHKKAITDIFLLSFIIYEAVSTDAYKYLYDNQRTVFIPVGIAKILDYISIPFRKFPDSSDLCESEGSVRTSVDFVSLLGVIEELSKPRLNDFERSKLLSLSKEELVLANNAAVNQRSKLLEFLDNYGFTITENELFDVLKLIRTKIESIVNSESRGQKFELVFKYLSELQNSVIKLSYVAYCPKYQFKKQLGIFKFRHTNNSDEYRILNSDFLDMNKVNLQICVIFLGLFRPRLKFDGDLSPSVLPLDVIVDLSRYTVEQLLRALFSFDIEIIDQAARGSIAGNDATNGGSVRQYSTLSKKKIKSNHDFIHTSIGMYTRIVVRYPLLITTLRDSPGSSSFVTELR